MTSSEQQDSQPLPKNVAKATSDWFLASFVNLVNNSPLEIGITLNVGGVMISGLLVGGKSYFEGFGGSIRTAFASKEGVEQETLEQLENTFKQTGERIYQQMNSEEESDRNPTPNPTPIPGFIHLKNARFLTPGSQIIPSEEGVWWRGKLDAVDGFVLGTLS